MICMRIYIGETKVYIHINFSKLLYRHIILLTSPMLIVVHVKFNTSIPFIIVGPLQNFDDTVMLYTWPTNIIYSVKSTEYVLYSTHSNHIIYSFEDM